MLRPGQTVDRYVVDAEIGRGACAVVYKVRHTVLNSMHALKLLVWNSPALRQRLAQEGRLQGQLRHPNVVPVTDVIDVEGQLGLVAEFIDGPTMAEWMQTRRLDLEESERIFLEVISGLASAHAAGVVHRDLKPSNILLQQLHGRHVPRITDFGIAKHLPSGGDLSLTRTGAAVGTPGYMAPEQFRDARNADVRADIFSAGCILYQLVTGRAPFSGNLAALEIAARDANYAPPEDLMPGLPDRIVTAIRRCLDPDPGKRFADCPALIEHLTGRSETIPSPMTQPELRPMTRIIEPEDADSAPARDPRRTVGLALVALLVLACVVWAVARSFEAAPTEGAEALLQEASDASSALPTPEGAHLAPPAPAPAPAPAEPALAASAAATLRPAPAASSTPAAAPRPPTDPAGGTVAVRGDAEEVWLVRDGRRFEMGTVPPGEYAIWARFPGEPALTAGSVYVRDDQRVTLSCQRAFQLCRPK